VVCVQLTTTTEWVKNRPTWGVHHVVDRLEGRGLMWSRCQGQPGQSKLVKKNQYVIIKGEKKPLVCWGEIIEGVGGNFLGGFGRPTWRTRLRGKVKPWG